MDCMRTLAHPVVHLSVTASFPQICLGCEQTSILLEGMQMWPEAGRWAIPVTVDKHRVDQRRRGCSDILQGSALRREEIRKSRQLGEKG